jgi:hypothetical protein
MGGYAVDVVRVEDNTKRRGPPVRQPGGFLYRKAVFSGQPPTIFFRKVNGLEFLGQKPILGERAALIVARTKSRLDHYRHVTAFRPPTYGTV